MDVDDPTLCHVHLQDTTSLDPVVVLRYENVGTRLRLPPLGGSGGAEGAQHLQGSSRGFHFGH